MGTIAMSNRGSLVIVSLGMTLGSHLTPLCRSNINEADLVMAGVSDSIVEPWLKEMHPDVRSLQAHYKPGSRVIDHWCASQPPARIARFCWRYWRKIIR